MKQKIAPELRQAVAKVSKVLKADIILWAGPLYPPDDREFLECCHRLCESFGVHFEKQLVFAL